MDTYWGSGGWCYGGWAGGPAISTNIFAGTAKKGTLSLRSGSILNITAKKGTFSLVGVGGANVNALAMVAKGGTLVVSGINGTIGDFVLAAQRGTLNVLGFSSTSGTLAMVAKHGVLSLKQLAILWGCTALCLDNVANSDYNNFEFDSFAVKDGYVMATNASGVYLLTGSDDAGTNIDVTVETVQDDLGAGELKTVPDVYVTYKGGPVVVQAVNQSNVRTGYEVEATTEMRTKRARVGQGVEKLLWGIRLTNQDGGSLDVDRIEMRPYKRSGRI